MPATETTIQPAANEQWDLVIGPKKGWFDLHLADIWRYRDLMLLFVKRDFSAKYKQTVLGPLWFIIQPLLTTLMFTVVFGNIAKISTDGMPKILFYLSGLTVWNYFAQCLTVTSNTFISNAAIFGKVYFPRLVMPLSVIISNLIQFGIQLALFLAIFMYFLLSGYPLHPNAVMLLIPVLLAIMAALGLGLGIIVSALTTRYRDLTHLVTFGVQLLMYATPVIYPLSSLSEKYRFLILANPASAVVETFRYAFLGTGVFEPMHLLWSAGAALVILGIGIVLFNHVERTFVDTV